MVCEVVTFLKLSRGAKRTKICAIEPRRCRRERVDSRQGEAQPERGPGLLVEKDLSELSTAAFALATSADAPRSSQASRGLIRCFSAFMHRRRSECLQLLHAPEAKRMPAVAARSEASMGGAASERAGESGREGGRQSERDGSPGRARALSARTPRSGASWRLGAWWS